MGHGGGKSNADPIIRPHLAPSSLSAFARKHLIQSKRKGWVPGGMHEGHLAGSCSLSKTWFGFSAIDKTMLNLCQELSFHLVLPEVRPEVPMLLYCRLN